MVSECKGYVETRVNKEEKLLMEGRIRDDSNLYVVDPAHFGNNEEACQVEPATESDKDSAAFAGMADVVEETEDEWFERENHKAWYRMHALSVTQGNDPMRQVRRIAWDDWRGPMTSMKNTEVPRVITELYCYMTEEEYDAFCPA